MNFRLFLEMSDIHALLGGALDRPDDDTPKLVAADWCDDHNFPATAALIRYGVEYARNQTEPNSYIQIADKATQEIGTYNVHLDVKNQSIWVQNGDGTPLGHYVMYPKGMGYFNHAPNPGDIKAPRRIRTSSMPDVIVVACFQLLARKLAATTPSQNVAESELRRYFQNFLILGGATNDTSQSLLRFLRVADALLKSIRRWDGQSQTDYAAHQLAEQLLWQIEHTNGQVASQDNVPANDALLAKINRIGREIVSELQRISKAAEARWRAAYPNA